MKTITIHIASINRRQSANDYCSLDSDGLRNRIAEYCRDEWDHEVGDEEMPEDREELIEMYFDQVDDEHLYTSEHTINLPEPHPSALELIELVTLALPYVEEAAEDPVNKPAPVKALAKRMRAAIEKSL